MTTQTEAHTYAATNVTRALSCDQPSRSALCTHEEGGGVLCMRHYQYQRDRHIHLLASGRYAVAVYDDRTAQWTCGPHFARDLEAAARVSRTYTTRGRAEKALEQMDFFCGR